MSKPGGTRDKERTRHAILEAAERLYTEQGNGVSIAAVAAAAGISKGGLFHHFPSREALEVGLAERFADKLWAEVRAHIDLSENQPGKLARAYIRALTSKERRSTVAILVEPASFYAVLPTTPAIERHYQHDAQRWREAFAADGLDPALMTIIQSAVDGLAAAMNTPYLNDRELTIGREALLQLTYGDLPR